MLIRNLEQNDIIELSMLHKRIFGSTHFSSTLSNKLLIKYFTLIISHLEFKFVAVENGKIMGYLLGGSNPNIPVSRFVKQNILSIAFVLIRNPVFLIEKLRGIFYSLYFRTNDVHKNSISVYLIAVNTVTQNRGLGKELLRTFEEKLITKKIEQYTLAVRTDNTNAIEFYKKNNFSEISRDYKSISFVKKLVL